MYGVCMMIRTQVYIPQEMMIDLRYLAKQKKLSVSDLIRKGADKVIRADKNQKKNTLESLIGKGKWGRKTNAVDVINDYYSKVGE